MNRGSRNPKVSYLHLHTLIPPRDVRKLIYALLTPDDRFVIRQAHRYGGGGGSRGGGSRGSRGSDESWAVFPKGFASRCASRGYLDLLKWARANGCDWNWKVCGAAADNGDLEMLKWARSEGCDWKPSVCSHAARNGHLELLKWAKANGCACDWNVCAAAGAGGHLSVLMWALSDGCEWTTHVCAYAAWGGHINVLEWAMSEQRPMSLFVCYFYAASNNRLNVIQWLRQNMGVWPVTLSATAVRYGYNALAQWLLDNAESV